MDLVCVLNLCFTQRCFDVFWVHFVLYFMYQQRTTVSSTGLSVNSSSADGYTPLHVAALHGHELLVELLLKRGAGVNYRNSSSQQCTPLHLACQCNHIKVGLVVTVHCDATYSHMIKGYISCGRGLSLQILTSRVLPTYETTLRWAGHWGGGGVSLDSTVYICDVPHSSFIWMLLS